MASSEPYVAVVDDDDGARDALLGLVRSAGLRAVGFASAKELLERAHASPPGCLVLDVDMPEMDGLTLQRRLRDANDQVPIVFVSGHADVPMSVRALKDGAQDFFTKPFDAEALLEVITRALSRRPSSSAPAPLLEGVVGTSAALRAVLEQVRMVAATETTVLIQGETGTGKERIARAIHELSPRRGGPLVKVNCAAIPAGLLESELMGHERGAFTGALAQRIGKFELAHRGTIFLDEIGEMPLALQPKLLRLLQERELERVGGSRTIPIDVRVVAATHRDLRALAADRMFREDLFYRLSVFPVTLPPLRDRAEDIPSLVHHFVAAARARLGRGPAPIREDVLAVLLRHDWPGNIRELQNVVERMVILAGDGELTAPALPRPSSEQRDGATPRSDAAPSDGLADVSRAHILRVLEETNWVVAGPRGAAARLAMKRTTLAFRMKKLGIVRPDPARFQG